MKPSNCVAILALLSEMVRRLNQNISKVELKPLTSFGDTAEPMKSKS